MDIKKSEEVLAEIHRNCTYALQSISDILPETDDEEIKAELLRQHEEYERIGGKAALLALLDRPARAAPAARARHSAAARRHGGRQPGLKTKEAAGPEREKTITRTNFLHRC